MSKWLCSLAAALPISGCALKITFEARARVNTMQEKNSSQAVHDRFFKYLMEIQHYATEIITAAFPDILVKNLDLSSLKKMGNVLDGRKDRPIGFQADVVFESGYGENVTVTLLFEHKSYREQFPHLQLLNYMTRIWLDDIKKHGYPRSILPVIFYHGQKEWAYRPFADAFKLGPAGEAGMPKELLPYVPEFKYIFVNLQEKGDEWIKKKIKQIGLRIALLVMRNIRSGTVAERLEELFEGAPELRRTRKGFEEIEEIFVYLYEGAKESQEKIIEAMDQSRILKTTFEPESIGWHVKKLAKEEGPEEGLEKGLEKGREKGREEGREEGIVEGIAIGEAQKSRELAMNFLGMGFEVETIAEASGLSIEVVESLKEEGS